MQSCIRLAETRNAEYFRIVYRSDGLRIAGYLGRPKDDGLHPAVVYNRGGSLEFGALQGPEIVPFVEAGYVAAASQYRGGPGSEGGDQYGGDDVHDVFALIDILHELSTVDAERIGMMGVSRGGMMTYLALKSETLSNRHRIRVASTMGGVANLFAWGRERPELLRAPFVSLIGARPDEAPGLFERRSATSWPELFNTPLLLLHGEADDRVAVGQSQELARLLTAAGKTVQLQTYSGEGHGLEGVDRGYPQVMKWFQGYLAAPGEDLTFETHREEILAARADFVSLGNGPG